ncbi:MAG: glutathione peroxidase [Bacteroidetes bacterium]|nr:glutathione peroxidase [Bacteroidota bacterium]
MQVNIYSFHIRTLSGEELDLSKFKGKRLLIVNTASKCGFTPQYAQLEDLYKKYKDKNFEIIGFPSNDFAHQEPGSNSEIQEFCQKNYGVSFTMAEKVHVKGDSICDVYRWLTHKDRNGKMSSHVKWNFQKYMIDESGNLVGVVSSYKSPECKKIIQWLEGKKK